MKLDWMGNLFIDDRFDTIINVAKGSDLKLKWYQVVYLKILNIFVVDKRR